MAEEMRKPGALTALEPPAEVNRRATAQRAPKIFWNFPHRQQYITHFLSTNNLLTHSSLL
jgi:hypothetical protein